MEKCGTASLNMDSQRSKQEADVFDAFNTSSRYLDDT